MKIKPGMMFIHKRRIDVDTNKPEMYRVTRTVGDTIYYRPINANGEYNGTPWKSREKYFFEEVLGSWSTVS